MQTFVYIFLATIILVSVVSIYLRKKNFSTFWIPAAFLIGISLIVAVVSYFTLNGWDSMGFFFLFLSITCGAIIGTALSFSKVKIKIIKKTGSMKNISWTLFCLFIKANTLFYCLTCS